MSDMRNPVHVGLTALAMKLLASGKSADAEAVAKVLAMYEAGRDKPEPKTRRRKDAAAAPLLEPNRETPDA